VVALVALATRNVEFYDGRVFDGHSIGAMRPSLQPMAWPWLAVHDAARERGMDLVTADQVRDARGVQLIAYDWTPDADRLLRQGARPATLVSFEPPVIAWQLFAALPRISRRFGHTFWFAGARDRARGCFHGLQFPQRCPAPQVPRTAWGERGFLVMINSNKALARAGQLRRWFEQPREVSLKHELAALRFRAIAQDRYRARLEAIDAFADRGDFDLYGEGWQVRHKGVSSRLHARALRAYRGPVQDKQHVLAGYRFALAIENTRFAGYISEKLFDCLVAGAIPVYDGAPDVAQYVPREAFVDLRRFADYAALERFLRALSEREAGAYLKAGQEFLHSRAFERFCASTFARELVDTLND
jgi:Glycosyltransferase family 10 (fucosyltransferase) C-term